MAQSRLLMRQIREVLRLHFEESFSQRVIARALGLACSTVERVFRRFAGSGLRWPPDPALTDVELERRLYAGAAHQGTAKVGGDRPDYADVVQVIRKIMLLRFLLSREAFN